MFKGHKPECAVNFSGSPNAIEIKTVEFFWKGSIDTCSMQCMTVLSDGDS